MGFFNVKTTSVSAAALIIGGSALASRLLGLFRDRLLAGSFGAGPELDVYFAAFRLPDLLHGIFVLGGLGAVLVPLFAEYKEKNDREAWEFVNALLHALLVFTGFLAAAAAFALPWLMPLVAPGFSPRELEVAEGLTRIMLLSPVIFAVSSVFSGVLQYFNRFLAYAAAPVAYNLGIIGGIVFLVPQFGVAGLAFGVVAGALLHLLVQVPAALASGFVWRPRLAFFDASVARTLRLALPRTVGGAAFHLNLIVMTALASTLGAGSIAVFAFADTLQAAPVGLVGLSVALAAFPALSRASARGDLAAFARQLRSSLLIVGGAGLAFSLLVFALAGPIVSFILQTGRFDEADAALTASVLGVFALGIFFQSLIPLLVRSFFALQDTKTPTAAGVGTVAVNILLAVVLLGRVEPAILALPMALVVSGLLQSFVLGLLLWRRLHGTHS